MFPTSKATTLESNNKSLVKPQQSSTSTSSGKEKFHVRPRRSVDGHASSLSSVSSTDSSTAVDMHELITSLSSSTISVDLDNVASTSSSGNLSINEDIKGDSNASLSSSIGVSINNGDLTTNNTLLDTHINEEANESMPKSTTTKAQLNTNTGTDFKFKNSINKSNLPLEPPLEIDNPEKKSKPDIAYDPDLMQSDSYPSIYSYGVQKLQYLKLLTRLKEVNEELHIYSNDTVDTDNKVEKFHYDGEGSSPTITLTTIAPKIITTQQQMTTDVPITTKPLLDETVIPITTNVITAHTEHVVSTPKSAVTNNLLKITTTEPTISPSEPSTDNMGAGSKTPEITSNAKHVLINLTISADDAENSSYKPLYSLAVTVPTMVSTNEVPTVKITPLDLEPTMPTNFNKPAIIQNTTKANKDINLDNSWGGSCECSCPVCENSPSDSFYEDSDSEKSTTVSWENTESSTGPSPSSGEDQYSSTSDSYGTQTTDMNTERSSELYTVESASVTDVTMTADLTEETTDLTREPDIPSTTEAPKCVCPKIEPPPILILEGEVFIPDFDQR